MSKTTKNVTQLKVPPHSLEAEQSVIGGLLIKNDAWFDISDKVSAGDFYSRSHRIIFSAIISLIENQKPADLLTIQEQLTVLEQLEDAGGYIYMAEMMKGVPSAANIEAYAEIVREKSVTRNIISVGNQITESGFDTQGRTSDELLDNAESLVFDIAETNKNNEHDPVLVSSMLSGAIDRLEALSDSDSDGITGVRSGFTDLDKLTSGYQPGDLVIVAARPSMGKTTFAMNCAEYASIHEEKPALVFSLEMPKEQLLDRLMASTGRVNQTSIRTGQLSDEDWGRLNNSIGTLSDSKLLIEDASNLTPNEVRSISRRMYREHGGLSMILVDYLQLMRVPEFSNNKNLEVSEISRSLKALAKELKVPVVALSQLNRELEKRTNKRPVMSDLRDSGALEQDADLIIFLYRDELYYDDSPHIGVAECIIDKQRNGPLGKVPLTFSGQYSRFDDYAGNFNFDED